MSSDNAHKRVAIYARITADPDGRAIGVTDQVRLCRDLTADRLPDAEITGPGCDCIACRRFDVPGDIYCDNDLSASGKVERPHYDRLVADIKAGRVDAVVTLDTDRLYRNVRLLLDYIEVCKPRNVPTYTVKSGNVDLSTPAGRAFATVGATFARYEWEQMVERQLNAKRRNREAGIRQGGSRPFGYQLDERDHRGHQIPGVSKGLEIDDREAAAVREMFSMFLAAASVYSIAKMLNAAGFSTPATGKVKGGGPFRPVHIRRMLQNGLYAGLIEREGVVTGRAQWDAIVSEDTWRAARAIFADPSRAGAPGPKPKNLLTGVLVCGVCDETRWFIVQAPNKGRGQGRTYLCRRGGTGQYEYHVSRAVESLDAYVEAIIIERLRRPDVVDVVNARPGVDVNELEGRRGGLRARLDELGALFADGSIDGLQLAAASKPLREKISEAENALSDAYRGSALEEFSGAADPEKVWDGLPIERKRAVARLLLRVVLYPARGKPMPPGWKFGEPMPFREDLTEITTPDGEPWS